MGKIIKVFCMQKDEEDILNEWIIYHSHLFGLHNLYIIDNHSGVSSKNILDHYKAQGLNVYIRDDYRKKGEYICELIKEQQNNCDLAIPLDLDEFICVVNPRNWKEEQVIDWARKCLSFDPQFYFNNDRELAQECKKNKWTAMDHFIKRGFQEQRQPCANGMIKNIGVSDCWKYIKKNERTILKNYPEFAISCDYEQIWDEINRLEVYGRYAFFQYLTSRNTETKYNEPIEEVLHFNKVDMENHEGKANFNKKFFDPKTLTSLDHGHHYGGVEGLHPSQYKESYLCLFHYHYRGIYKLIEKCKNDINGLYQVNNINDRDELKEKVKLGVPGAHNIETYLKYHTQGPYSLYMSESEGIKITAMSDKIRALKTELM